MLCRFETHCHSYFSKDAVSPPEAILRAAKAKGLNALAITDHDSCESQAYLQKQGLMREDGEAVDGFLFVPGVEVSTKEGHLLCLGVEIPYRKGIPAAEVVAEVHELGGIAIPAHPFDVWRAGIHPNVLDELPIDAVEVFNAAVTSKTYNALARAYAEERGLPMTSGSDAHHVGAVGTAFTSLEVDRLCVAEVLRTLCGRSILEEHYLTLAEGVKKHLCNWLRFLNPSPPKSDTLRGK